MYENPSITRKDEKMKFTDLVFERATIRGIGSYLLYGQSPGNETRDYDTRLGDAYMEYEKTALQCEKQEKSALIEAADVLTSETANVYTEIGPQAGLLLMQDMMENQGVQRKCEAETVHYRIMYDLLFREVTSAWKALQDPYGENVSKAVDILKEGQCRAEEVFNKSE